MVDLKDEFPDLFPEEESVALVGSAENDRLNQVTNLIRRDAGNDAITPSDVLNAMTCTWLYLDIPYIFTALEVFSKGGFLGSIGVPAGMFSMGLGACLLDKDVEGPIFDVARNWIAEEGYQTSDGCYYGTCVRVPDVRVTYDSTQTLYYEDFTLIGDFERTGTDAILTDSSVADKVRNVVKDVGDITPDALFTVMSNCWLYLDDVLLCNLYFAINYVFNHDREDGINFSDSIGQMTESIALWLDMYTDPEYVDEDGLVLSAKFYGIGNAYEGDPDCYHGTTITIEKPPEQSA